MKKSIWAIGGVIIFVGIVGISLYKTRTAENDLTAQTSQPAIPNFACIDTDNDIDRPTSGAGLQISLSQGQTLLHLLVGATSITQSGNGGVINYIYWPPGGPSVNYSVPYTIISDSATPGSFWDWLWGHDLASLDTHHEVYAFPGGSGKCLISSLPVPKTTPNVNWMYKLRRTPYPYVGTPVFVGTLTGKAATAP